MQELLVKEEADRFLQESGSERVTVWVKSDDKRFIVPVYMLEVDEIVREQIAIDLLHPNGGLVVSSVLYDDWLIVNKHDTEIKTNSALERLTDFCVKHSITVPIRKGGEVIGVLQGLNKPSRYCYADVLSGERCAEQISAYLDFVPSLAKYEKQASLFLVNQELNGVSEKGLDRFVFDSLHIMSALWNLSKSLEILSCYPDTVDARLAYEKEVFTNKMENINKRLEELSEKIKELREQFRDDEKVRRFIHQINPTIAYTSANLDMLGMCFEREKKGVRVYGHTKFIELIKSIVDGLNMFYRLVKQHIYLVNPFKFKEVHGNELRALGESFEGLMRKFTYNGETIEIDYQVDLLVNEDDVFLIDVLAVKECIETLLFNAGQELVLAGVENPKVRLVISKNDSFLEIAVKDNGRGVPINYRDMIFEKYFTSNKPGGTGIGLSVVKEMVEKMGGSVTQYNEDGAVFTLLLPIASH